MTIELALAIISLAGAVLTAGKVIFSTESKVESLTKAVESLNGKAQAMDALANEGKTAHFRLEERVEALAEVVATKATAESVVNIKESVDSLRRDIKEGFAEITKRLDHTPPSTRKR